MNADRYFKINKSIIFVFFIVCATSLQFRWNAEIISTI